MSSGALSTRSPYAEHVNFQWVRLLDLLEMNVRYEHSAGVGLFAENGDRYLDFLSGYCARNAGHNHPRIVEAHRDELARSNNPAKPRAETVRASVLLLQRKQLAVALARMVTDFHQSTAFWTDALALRRRTMDI